MVCSHPDDDIFGVGATLKVRSVAFPIKTIYMGNGVGSRDDTPSGAVEKRLDAMEKANILLGVKEWEVGLLEDQRFDTYPIIELAKFVEKHILEWGPYTIFTHSQHDLNRDHRLTHEAVMIAARPMPSSTIVDIYSFEVPSATEWGLTAFRPTVYYQGDFRAKIEALKLYGDEVPAAPHPRSIEAVTALGFRRGAECGRMMAEAFELQRMVI